MSENKNNAISFVELITLLLSTSAIGYLIAFSYEYGYFSAYDLPLSLLTIDNQSIIIAITETFAFILVGFCLSIFIYPFISHFSGKFLSPLQVSWVLFLISTYLIKTYLFGFSLRSLIMVVIFVWALISDMKYIHKLNLDGDKSTLKTISNLDDKYNLVSKITRFMGIGPFFLFVIFGNLYFFASDISYYFALNQKKYLIPQDHPNYVVLRTCDNKFICKKIHFKSKKLFNKILILSKEELNFTYEAIGPLKIKKKSW